MYMVGCGAQCYMARRAEVFDPATRSWWRLPDAPGAEKAKAGCLEGRVHVVGGLQSVTEFSSNDASGFFHFRYDPAANAWETLPRFPGGFNTHGMVVGAAGVVYAFADYGKPNHFWGYDVAAEAWDRKADVPLDVWGACGAESGGHLYLFGGRGRVSGSWTEHKTAFRYDATSDAWVQLADAPGNLGGTSTACDSDESTGLIYVAALKGQNGLNRELYTCAPGPPYPPFSPAPTLPPCPFTPPPTHEAALPSPGVLTRAPPHPMPARAVTIPPRTRGQRCPRAWTRLFALTATWWPCTGGCISLGAPAMNPRSLGTSTSPKRLT